jgi:2-iminobutanoate/2-iminopropanoate deaminase
MTSGAGARPRRPLDLDQERITPVTTPDAPTPSAPYSQAIAAAGMLFVSGQRPELPRSTEIPSGIEAQTHQVLRNLATVLDAGGSDLSQVVKVTAYLADLGLFDRFNAAYRQHFAAPFPARTTVACGLRGILVEIDAIALGPSPSARARQQEGGHAVIPG